MDIRSVSGAAGTALAWFNARHPWSHNDHFHGWVPRRLPERRERAIDVGCGRGELLARLSPEFGTAQGTDRDAAMRAAAAARCSALPNVDVDDALAQVRRILAPGGRFLVVGLARPDTAADLLWDAACSITNPLIGVAKHPRALRTPPAGAPFPVAEPALSYSEIRNIVARELPGARLRRRLAFRYTAEWTKPGRAAAG